MCPARAVWHTTLWHDGMFVWVWCVMCECVWVWVCECNCMQMWVVVLLVVDHSLAILLS